MTFPALKASPRRADPCVIVIFGAAGDLTKRKLIPALYNLAKDGLIADQLAVIGVARAPLSSEAFRDKIGQDLQEFTTDSVDAQLWNWFAERLYYLSGNFQDPNTYSQLKDLLTQLNDRWETQANYLYYLATAPEFFCDIVWQLETVGIARERSGCWRRFIIEKPFGHDLESAQALNKNITAVLKEQQIYRIDHYLGKETVQNILMFRFGNGLFEHIWNHHYIDHVQITVAETVGVENRGGYYDTTGALRDMVQNHLFQILSMVAIEPPVSFDADAVRDEKTKVLRAIQPFTEKDVLTDAVRGQYGLGDIKAESVPAYRNEPKVAPESSTETFAALKVTIDNWRWANVPFYLRTGKRLNKRVSEIVIQFKRVPSLLFRQTSIEDLSPNILVLRIQPNEGINLQFGAKVPGPIIRMDNVWMDFCYGDYFKAAPTTGYETLIYDCMIGDATLFQRSDNVELGWTVVTPILDVWQALPIRQFPNYAAGSWGPKEADDLLARSGRQWRNI
jgi:glucose-6-phosphate 1-dehydrogenase